MNIIAIRIITVVAARDNFMLLQNPRNQMFESDSSLLKERPMMESALAELGPDQLQLAARLFR